MITRGDCYLLLSDLKAQGIDTASQVEELKNSTSVPISVVQFINNNRKLDLSNFYENLRKNYNNKKSKLYGNIVKEIDKPDEILTTLSSFLTQAILFSKKLEDKEMFLRHARVADITRVLTSYFRDFDLSYCIKLMQILKADIKALESRGA